jgi:pimeloyl-ACP methyl ester carboxylesterase
MAEQSTTAAAQGQLVSFKNAKGTKLNGGLFTTDKVPAHDIAVISTHGAANNFYSSVTGFLSPALPLHGYPTLSMNLSSHDRFYSQVPFEDCELDFAAGVKFMQGLGYKRFVLFGHSLSVTQIVYYVARSQEPSVVGLALSAGHDDLRGISWRNWENVAADPKAEHERVVAECRKLIAEGNGDRLFVIPWWSPDPKLKLRQQYREISALAYVSNRAPDSNCNASRWIPAVKAPTLFIGHSVVDTTAAPDMMERLRKLATSAAFTDFVNIEGSGHFYVGFESQLIGAVVSFIDKVRKASAIA